MNLDDVDLASDDLAFLHEVRSFYEANLTDEFRRAGSMVAWVFAEFEPARKWQRILYARGWGAPHWPVEHGGADWTPTQRLIWEAESARAMPPPVPSMGRDLCAPCIMAFGTDEQKREFLPAILRGDDWWAQGYSEPGAGSDLAALQLRAVPVGDSYILNGSKIWTTYAQYSNRIFCLVRTAQSSSKHHGISFLLVDMKSPGIEVRPIVNIAGDQEFNEVFFTDVRVPKTRLLGVENEGWNIVRYMLRYEHGGSARSAGELGARMAWLHEIARLEADGAGGTLVDDPDFSRRMAEVSIAVEAIEFAAMQVLAASQKGAPPPPSVPLLRIRAREVGQALSELAMEAIAYQAAPFEPEARRVEAAAPPVGPPHTVLPMPYYLSQRAMTIAGGTPDIQRNNLAKSLLGL